MEYLGLKECPHCGGTVWEGSCQDCGKPNVVVSERVALAPHTDAWMRGIRYATVTKIGRTYVHLVSDHGVKLRVPLDSVESL